ncbi:carbohydrate porin [Acidithiobacillus sp. IBUN Pt1247-S3]|uniref:carbohydrate porin n=1 Tax=Acidithiobacillus sp. IBUN Pt1247-S3 TaxID=3166642 RepID=UPI0034E4C226
MKFKTFSFLTFFMSGSSLASGLPGPGADSPIPVQNGIAPRYLTDFQHIGQGLSWSAHLDTELFANLAGGIRQGTASTSAGQLGLQWNTNKAGVWPGGLFTASAFGIYSSAEDTAYSGDLQTASNIYAPSAIRLYELNYRQQWTDWLATRVGYTDFNLYFDVASNALQLLNGSFGLDPSLSGNVPALPTYPYSGLGFIVHTYGGNWSSKAAIFQGDAVHQYQGVFDRGYFAIWEGALHWGHEEGEDADDDTDEYGQYVFKVGAWHYRQPRAPAFDLSPTTNGVYGIVEAHWQIAGAELAPFLQWGKAFGRENLVPWYLGAGARLSHFLPARPDDALSFGMARAALRPGVVAAGFEDEEQPAAIYPAETSYELTYVAKLNDYLSLQPDLQYIVHPNGVYPNATVGLLRLHLEFF